MYRLLICFAIILAFFSMAQAQRNFNATVQVTVVSTKDTPDTGMAKILEKELGDLVDVDISKDKPDFSLYVFLEKIPTNGPAFYAVTFNSFKSAECSYKNAIVDGKVARTDCKSLVRVSSTAFISEAQVADKAKEIANSFNLLVIDPDRKAYKLNRSLYGPGF